VDLHTCEKRMVRMSFPWLVSNPVRSTTAMHPPSGVRTGADLSPVCCRIFVPPNSTCTLSRFMLSRWLGSSSKIGVFHWGVLSPVNRASLAIAVPARSRRSPGTVRSSAPGPVGRPIDTRSPGTSWSPFRRLHLCALRGGTESR
jgi:hypothetical protein